MRTDSPNDWHQQQSEIFHKKAAQLSKQKNNIGWIRLSIFFIGGWLTWLSWPAGFLWAFFCFAAFLAGFLLLLAKSLKLEEQIKLLNQKASIHEEEMAIANHQFLQRYDAQNLLPKIHDYAADIDIFGQASLFQFIHRSTSQQGHQTLANWLLQPADQETIYKRQNAIKTLAANPEWSIQFQAIGELHPINKDSETKFSNWLPQPSTFHAQFWKIISIIFPTLSLLSLLLHISGYLSAQVFYTLVLIYIVIAFAITKKVMPQYKALDKIVPQLNTLSDSLQWIIIANFKKGLLGELTEKLQTITGTSEKRTPGSKTFAPGSKTRTPGSKTLAPEAIKRLQKILDRFDYRLNPLVFLPLNSFLLWDLQQVLALEKWKATHQNHVPGWFRVLEEMEALNSLCRLYFNHPQWSFPEIVVEHGTYEANEIGHPLIPQSTRINNNFATTGDTKISLITGSNMAGKSTFLRTLGVNQVLALAGAPVCAKQLHISVMKLMSSMRIADNLEENTSTFYAELKKLKTIIEAVNQKEKVFLLLDEILRGTNSRDRHTGSEALIRQLIHQHAVGLLATHDLLLAELEQQFPQQISNYHFDVQVAGEELYFDYLLKPGVCTSLNASILMKKIGLHLT